MPKLDLYDIDLKNLLTNNQIVSKQFEISNSFFDQFESEEIKGGNITVEVNIKKEGGIFHLLFFLQGKITIACTRCLDDMQQEIHCKEEIKVKLGDDYSDENDIITIPEAKGILNASWYIYEFIALNIPITHTHSEEDCNQDIIAKLYAYTTKEKETEDIDPRWEQLKNIFENN